MGHRRAVAQAVPELLGEVRNEWREEKRELLELGTGEPHTGRLIHEFDHRGDRGVECKLLDVLTDLVYRSVKTSFDGVVPLLEKPKRSVLLIDHESPGTLEETMHSDYVPGVPGRGRLQRTHVHLVETHRVGAVLGDDIIRIHDVAK